MPILSEIDAQSAGRNHETLESNQTWLATEQISNACTWDNSSQMYLSDVFSPPLSAAYKQMQLLK
jgi:hypothetical protein